VGYFHRSLWLPLTLLIAVVPAFQACDNPFGWVKDDKKRAYIGLCSFQDPRFGEAFIQDF
jgi:hypothetical protein